MTQPFVVGPGEGQFLDLGNFAGVVLARPEQTDGAYSLIRTQDEPPGFGPPMHRHLDAAEAFFVLEGEYLMHLEDRRQRCPAGSFVHVPRGVAHTFTVVSDVPGRKLNLFTPAAMLGFFEDLAAAEAAGTPTPEELDAIAARHQMEIVGPVPDTYL